MAHRASLALSVVKHCGKNRWAAKDGKVKFRQSRAWHHTDTETLGYCLANYIPM